MHPTDGTLTHLYQKSILILRSDLLRNLRGPFFLDVWAKTLHKAINHERPHYATIYSHRKLLPLKVKYSRRHAFIKKNNFCSYCTLKDEVPHISNLAGRNVVLYFFSGATSPLGCQTVIWVYKLQNIQGYS